MGGKVEPGPWGWASPTLRLEYHDRGENHLCDSGRTWGPMSLGPAALGTVLRLKSTDPSGLRSTLVSLGNSSLATPRDSLLSLALYSFHDQAERFPISLFCFQL